MGNSTSAPHNFVKDLEAICGEGETPSEKKPIMEANRKKIARKGSFGLGSFGRMGVMKDLGINCVVGQVEEKKLQSEDFKKVARLFQVDDAHVVRLVAVVTSGSPYLIIYENCLGGDLPQHLQRNPSLGKKDLYRIMSDVADGMATLESLNIAHGNVCPLSILVFEAGSLFKVGNFLGELGSPEHVYLAPEVPSVGASSAGDVWAFAILVYFLLNQGTFSSSGRPSSKGACDEDLFEILSRCWSVDIPARPDFFWLRADFEERCAN